MKRIIFFMLAFLMLLSSVNALGTTGLISYYNFTNLNDQWGTNNLESTATVANGYITMDGVTVGNIANSSTSLSLTDTSVSLWINPDDTTTGIGIFDYQTTTQNFGLDIFGAGGVGDVRLYTDTDGTIFSNKFSYAATTWQNLVITVNDATNNVSFYLDGVFKGSTTSFTQPLTAVNQIVIGGQKIGTDPFKGKIDNVSIWEKTLTSSEVTNLYNNGVDFSFPAPTTNLSSFYNTQGFRVSVTHPQIVNLTYSLNGAPNVTICTSCNSSSALIENLSVGVLNTIKWNALKAGGDVATLTQNFTYDPRHYFYFNASGTLLTNFSFGGNTSVGKYVTLSQNNLALGSNTKTFSKIGYISSNFTFSVANRATQLNQTFNVNESKIILTIYDRETLNLIAPSVTTVTLQANVGFNGTTNTGRLNISNFNFIEQQYQILAENPLYSSETVFFTFNNQEELNINVYMLNSSSADAGTITLIVKNSLSQFIQGATCNALEWRASESAFVTVAQGETNAVGQTQLNIEIGTKIYKFLCSKGAFSTTTVAQIVQVDASSLTIILDDAILQPSPLYENLIGSFTNSTVNATHQLLNFTFSDSDGTTTQGCIKTYQKSGNRETLLSSTCATTSTGSIAVITNVNNTYDLLAKATLTNNEVTNYVFDTILFKGTLTIETLFSPYNMQILLPVLFYMMGIGLGLAISSLEIAAILGAGLTFVAVAVTPSIISMGIALFVLVITFLMLWGGYRR